MNEEKNWAGEEKRNGKKYRTAVAAGLVFGLVSSVAFQVVDRAADHFFPKNSPVIEETTENAWTEELSEEAVYSEVEEPTEQQGGRIVTTSAGDSPYSVADVAAVGLPSIVAITSVSIQEIPDYFGRFFGFGSVRQYPSTGSGSGIIVGENEEELLIATNNHVVSGAKTITVCFIGSDVESAQKETKNFASGNGDLDLENSVTGKLKGEDAENDLAVIAVKKADIPEETLQEISVAKLGNSDRLVVGEQVVAIGNALGVGQSVTSGYVSALNRSITTEEGTNPFLIQTDTAINPGNSGGALLNMRGEVIGINSAKYADSLVEGMGYAIPMSTAKPILEELMNRKTREVVEDESKAAYLGVNVLDLTEEMIFMYDLPHGAYIKEVTSGGPAEAAGLQKGDIIAKLDGQSVSGREDLIDRLSYYEADETVEMMIYRSQNGDYEEQSVQVLLGRKIDSSNGDADISGVSQHRRSEIPSIDEFFNYFG